MQDHRGNQIEVSSECAHIATRTSMQLKEDNMWMKESDNEDAALIYKDDVQDVYNDFYDEFDTIVTNVFEEPKVYFLHSDDMDNGGFLIPNNEQFDDKLFINNAEAKGNVLSLIKFQQQLNAGEFDIANNFIHIKH